MRYSRASPSHASAAPTEVFRECPENRRIREVQFMLPEFVIESAAAGGCRLSLPDKLRWGSGGAQSEAEPPPAEAAAPPHDFQKNSGNPKTLAALIYGGQWSSIECAAARWLSAVPTADKLRWGSGGAQSEAEPPPAEAAAPPHDFQKNSGNPKTLAALIYGGQWSSIECAAAGCGAYARVFRPRSTLRL